MVIQRKIIAEGINLYMLPDKKFKNVVEGIYFSMPLQKETTATLALLPKLLTAGNAHFQDRTALHVQLEALYGAKFRAGTDKVGEVQVVSFVGDWIADAYAGENLFSQMHSLIQQVICEPKVSDGAWEKTTFLREMEALREDITSVVNDKRRYALLRLVEEMCKEEAYGLRTEGREEDLAAITPESAFSVYQTMLKEARVDIFVVGSFDEKEAVMGAEALAAVLGGRKGEYPKTSHQCPKEVRFVEDREAVTQGKLVMGYRTDLDTESEAYYPLMVYNAVFGGGTASKLFNTVREKMSLCYYASSSLERLKGLLLVQSGIEFESFAVARDAIEAQNKEIREGKISEAEFRGAVQGIVNQLRSYKDSPALMMEYYRRQLPLGDITDIDTVIEKILCVTPSEIPEAAKHIYLDTVYFLNGLGGETK